MAGAIKKCGPEENIFDIQAVEYLTLYDPKATPLCHTARLHIRTGKMASQFVCCKLAATIQQKHAEAKISMQGDPAESAIYSRLYEAKDAIAASSTTGDKLRVDRRRSAIKHVDTNTTILMAKLVDGRIKWLPSLKKLDPLLTAGFMAENFGL